MARSRKLAVPLVLAAALAASASFFAHAFVGLFSSHLGVVPRPAPASSVTLHGHAPKWKGRGCAPNKKAVKERQAERSRKKNKKGEEDEEKAEAKNPWPLDIPEGVTVLHIETDDTHGKYPQPGNWELQRFYQEMHAKFGHNVRFVHNYKKALAEFSPTGEARPGSFEVTDCATKKLLFSKLTYGDSIIHRYGGSDAYITKWMDKFSEETGTLPRGQLVEA